MKVGRLQMNQWNAGLNIESKIYYQNHSSLKKMMTQNRYNEPVTFVMIDDVKQESYSLETFFFCS